MGVRGLLFSLLGLAQSGNGQGGLRHLENTAPPPSSGGQQVAAGEAEGSDWGDISAIQTDANATAVSLLSTAKSEVFDDPGCCFAISHESDDTPCCLTRESWSWKECFTTAVNPFTAFSTPDHATAAITTGVAQSVVGTVGTLSVEKGWNMTCPETAAEAHAIIMADKARSKPASFDQPVSESGSTKVPANSSNPFMDALRQEVIDEIHQGLPWWGWCLFAGVLIAAMAAEVLQVLRERHSKQKSHDMRRAEVEAAKKIFSTGRVPDPRDSDTDEARPGRWAQTSPAQQLATAPASGQNFVGYQAAAADPRVVQIPQAQVQAQQYYYQAQQPLSPTSSPQYYLVSGSSVKPT